MQNESSSVLSQFQHGDPAAFETLFRMHQRAVQGWLLRIVRNHAAAEDLTVETFLRIHQAHARFDPGQGFEGWARRIATRAALDWLRTQKTECELPENLPAAIGSDPAISAEIRDTVALALSRLPPKLRIAATLALIEQLPGKAIAEALGISLAAQKLRVFRALRLLRNDLERQGITP